MLKKLLFICCAVVLLTACPGEPLADLKIINQSDEDILWTVELERFGEWYETVSHPWTNELGEINYGTSLILRGDTFHKFLGTQSNLKIGWIKYCLFNYDSVKTIPWQRICDERIILKEVRFDTWEDFEKCNFEITYP